MTRSSSLSTGNSNSSSGGTIIRCKDCGNKAKRGCEHVRCRSCCKSRGYKCATHVKSTWVPVSKRRLKLYNQIQYQQFHFLPSSTIVDCHHNHHHPFLSLSSATDFHHCTSSTPGQEGGNLPVEVNSLATFKCIRVSCEDNMVEQYAYQTSIDVGGHNFKGILYDQGPTASGADGGGDQSEGANLIYPSQYHHPPLLYATPFDNEFHGMQFFPHPK